MAFTEHIGLDRATWNNHLIRTFKDLSNSLKISLNHDLFVEFAFHFLPPPTPHLKTSRARHCDYSFNCRGQILRISWLT